MKHLAVKISSNRQESASLRAAVSATLLFVTLTGLLSWLGTDSSFWAQSSLLFHVLVGIPLLIVLPWYMLRHFLRVGASNKGPVFSSGLFFAIGFFVVAGTGAYLAVVGSIRLNQWVSDLHSIAGLGLVLILAMHLVAYIQMRKVGKVPLKPMFGTAQLFKVALSVTLVAGGGAIYGTSIIDARVTQPSVQPYQLPYGHDPFAPSLTEFDGYLDLARFPRSANCGRCHHEITEQWKGSMHALAAADPAYVKNIDLLVEAKGMEAARYCEGCHAPLALLGGQLTTGGKHGGTQGTVAHDEGVGCLVCHGVSAITSTEGVGSFRLSLPRPYLFDDAKNSVMQGLNQLLIKLNPDRHRRDLSRPVIKTAEFCSACHEQFMDERVNGWGWIKLQRDYSSWLESPFSKQQATPFNQREAVLCKDCHMVRESGFDPAQQEPRLVKGHGFHAANTAIPHLLGDEEGTTRAERFLQADRLRVTIDEPKPSKDQATRIHLQQRLKSTEAESGLFFLGDEINFNVQVANIGVGHAFPGGTPDINEAWLSFRVVDAENRVVFESGAIDDQGYVDPKARFFRSVPINAAGKAVLRHDLFNAVGESDKSTINPGESERVSYSLTVPYWSKSPLTVSATLRYRKFNRHYSQFVFDRYVSLPIVDVASDSRVLTASHSPHR